MRVLRFLLFNALSWAAVIFTGTGVILVSPFGHRIAYAVARSWCVLVIWLLRIICGVNVRVEGLENFPADSCVVFLKHSSAMETIAQLVFFPRSCWVLKRELLWVPFFGWALMPLQSIAIDRSSGSAAVTQVIEQGKQRLAAGINVSVFPEGTRMAPGTTKRYGKSGTVLAQEAGCLIVPIAHNAGYHWPRRGLAITPGTITFVIGKPVDPRGRDARKVNESIQAWVEAEIAKIVSNESGSNT